MTDMVKLAGALCGMTEKKEHAIDRKPRGFEDFLQDYFISKNPTLLDDDISDAFGAWVSGLEYERVRVLADIYGQEQFLSGMKHCEQITMNVIKNVG